MPRWIDVSLTAAQGAGAPLGLLGGAIALRFFDRISVDAGGGLGLSGPQFAAMSRLKLGGDFRARHSLWFGFGWSAGDYRWVEGGLAAFMQDGNAVKEFKPARWANFELSYLFRPDQRGLRIFVGDARLLNQRDGACVQSVSHCLLDHKEDPGWQPYFGAAFNYTL
jgi:hypothetical protein